MNNIRKGVLILVCANMPDGKKYLVVKQRNGTWSLPSGGIEPGETEDIAAKRELYEETGIQAQEMIATDLQNEFFYDPRTMGSQHCFLTYRQDTTIPGIVLKDEILDTAWVDQEEAKGYLMKPNQYDLFCELCTLT